MLAKLFYSFMKIGAFTIGGGYAMIPIIENEIVKKNNWISDEEFLDMVECTLEFEDYINEYKEKWF